MRNMPGGSQRSCRLLGTRTVDINDHDHRSCLGQRPRDLGADSAPASCHYCLATVQAKLLKIHKVLPLSASSHIVAALVDASAAASPPMQYNSRTISTFPYYTMKRFIS